MHHTREKMLKGQDIGGRDIGVFGRLSVDFDLDIGAGVQGIPALGDWTVLFSDIRIGTSAEESII
jgi:hypothetical protein